MSFALSLALVSNCYCQRPERVRISDYLDQLAQSRSAVKTYTVRINGVFLTRNGKTTVPAETVNSAAVVTVEIACDMLQDMCMIIVQQGPLLPAPHFTRPVL